MQNAQFLHQVQGARWCKWSHAGVPCGGSLHLLGYVMSQNHASSNRCLLSSQPDRPCTYRPPVGYRWKQQRRGEYACSGNTISSSSTGRSMLAAAGGCEQPESKRGQLQCRRGHVSLLLDVCSFSISKRGVGVFSANRSWRENLAVLACRYWCCKRPPPPLGHLCESYHVHACVQGVSDRARSAGAASSVSCLSQSTRWCEGMYVVFAVYLFTRACVEWQQSFF